MKQEDKVAQWIKKNATNFALIFVIGIFMFYDLVTFGYSGKVWYEILADGSVYMLVAVLITNIMGKKGILSGLDSEKLINTKKLYATRVEDSTPNLDRLDNYCEFKNANELKRMQTKILRHARIKYENFIKEDFDTTLLTKKQLKIYNKALHIKIRELTPEYILSEDSDRFEKGKADLSIRQYELSQNASTLVSKILFSVIFGVFSLYPKEGFNVAWLISSGVKVALWLGMSIMQYYNNYNFITTTYRSGLVRKVNWLEEFNTIIAKNPNAFITQEEQSKNTEKKFKIDFDKIEEELQ